MSLIQPPPPEADDGLPRYRQKPRPIGFELAYTLEGQTLVIDSTRKVDRVNLAAVEQVRFAFKPGNISSTGYITQLRMNDGKTVTIGDISWRSMVEVERGAERYVRFITALCAAIASANPSARFVAGRSLPVWALFCAVVALTVVMMVYFILAALAEGAQGAVWIGAFLLAAVLWQMIPMMINNRPLALKTGEIPPHLMPKPG
jgi:hypothetical protein